MWTARRQTARPRTRGLTARNFRPESEIQPMRPCSFRFTAEASPNRLASGCRKNGNTNTRAQNSSNYARTVEMLPVCITTKVQPPHRNLAVPGHPPHVREVRHDLPPGHPRRRRCRRSHPPPTSPLANTMTTVPFALFYTAFGKNAVPSRFAGLRRGGPCQDLGADGYAAPEKTITQAREEKRQPEENSENFRSAGGCFRADGKATTTYTGRHLMK